jgi:hypothetical protein
LVPPAEPRVRAADAPRVRDAEALVARGRDAVLALRALRALRVRARELDDGLELVERVAGAERSPPRAVKAWRSRSASAKS